jgi:hypothetical protein
MTTHYNPAPLPNCALRAVTTIALLALALAMSGTAAHAADGAYEAEVPGGRCLVVEGTSVAGQPLTPEVERCVPWPTTNSER